MDQITDDLRATRRSINIAAFVIVAAAAVQLASVALMLMQPRINATLANLLPGNEFRKHAMERIAAGDYAGLISAAQTYRKTHSDDPYVFYFLGIGYQGLGDHQQALKNFRIAESMAPTWSEQWTGPAIRKSQQALASLGDKAAGTQAKPAPWHVTGSMTTSGENLSHDKRIPVRTFGSPDFVACLVDLAWEDPMVGAGQHSVEWRWYVDKKMVSRSARTLTFDSTPYTLEVRRAAATLGAGHVAVTTAVDGRVVASNECDIAR